MAEYISRETLDKPLEEMTREEMRFKKALDMFELYHEQAMRNAEIKNKAAWALYRTWEVFDTVFYDGGDEE